VLPTSPEARAARYARKNWKALTRYRTTESETDNNTTERTIRGVAVGRGNWMFFGSDIGGRIVAVLAQLRGFCQRLNGNTFTWFKDVLASIGSYPTNRVAEPEFATLIWPTLSF